MKKKSKQLKRRRRNRGGAVWRRGGERASGLRGEEEAGCWTEEKEDEQAVEDKK